MEYVLYIEFVLYRMCSLDLSNPWAEREFLVFEHRSENLGLILEIHNKAGHGESWSVLKIKLKLKIKNKNKNKNKNPLVHTSSVWIWPTSRSSIYECSVLNPKPGRSSI